VSTDTHTAIHRDIFGCIRAGGYASGRAPDFSTFADGHRENVIADGILRRARERRWVEVPKTC
jgi:hypothetical protein